MSRTKMNVAVIGGDLRQISAAEELSKAGFSVSFYGFDSEYVRLPSMTKEEALKESDLLLLPIPVTKGEYLNMPFSKEKLTPEELVESVGSGVRIAAGGRFPAGTEKSLKEKGVKVFDLCEDERFNLMNSVPTAEGAVAIAMGNMKITLNGCRAVVLGFGRVGKTLCRLLHAFGAKVTAVSRSAKDRALSEIYGYEAVSFASLREVAGEADVLFNTVPQTVLGEEALSVIKKEAFVIDLASRPGGVDGSAALRCGVRVITALSIPGKVAPVTAGRIIARCLSEKLEEEGLW